MPLNKEIYAKMTIITDSASSIFIYIYFFVQKTKNLEIVFIQSK